MKRRVLPIVMLCLPAMLGAADPARDAEHVVTELAAALTAGNVQEFMTPFDRAVAGYDRLRAGVAALAAQGETQTYLEVVRNEGNERERTLQVDWELRILRSGDATPSARREVRVTCRLVLRGKGWRIVEFAPVDFLAP